MAIGDMIRDEKVQFDINKEAEKISTLSSGKIDKYEYFTCEEILPFNWRQIIERAKFAYSPLWKALEKQTEKQVGALNYLDPFNKKDNLKQNEDIFQQNLMKDFIRLTLKEIVNVQGFIKTIM